MGAVGDGELTGEGVWARPVWGSRHAATRNNPNHRRQSIRLRFMRGNLCGTV